MKNLHPSDQTSPDPAADTPLISGFSFARNTAKLGYPVVESIQSVLPICDEFVIALGKGDDDDTTREQILSMNSPKVKIIGTEWKNAARLRGAIYIQQTNLAKEHCRGKWCLYLQADEVIHERYHETITEACRHFAGDLRVDGFLFNYKHFWGDYDHYLVNHRWYPREIRLVRNIPAITSAQDATSFLYTNGKKVKVVQLPAEIFHYGHVRDPRTAKTRINRVDRFFRGEENAQPSEEAEYEPLDYGSLEKLPRYTGTHPKVMQKHVDAINWKHLLQYSGKPEQSST